MYGGPELSRHKTRNSRCKRQKTQTRGTNATTRGAIGKNSRHKPKTHGIDKGLTVCTKQIKAVSLLVVSKLDITTFLINLL